MTEELRLHVVSTSDSKGLRDSAKDITGLRGETDRLTGSFDRAEGEAFDLSKALEESRKRAAELRKEFAATGDTGLFREMRKERSLSLELGRVRRDLFPDLGPDVAQGLIDTIVRMRHQFMGAGVLAGGAVAVSMAPIVGGILSSAVLGAAGIGGVVGGAILAARDERVKSAWKELGAGLLEQLKPAQDAFVGPMLDAARMIGSEFKQSGLVDTLMRASELVDPLARGLMGFVTELKPGLDSAFTGGLSNMRMLGGELADLGTSISDMLDSMAKAGDESAIAFKDALDVTEDLIAGIGDLTAGLATVYALTRNPLVEKVFDVVPAFGLIGAIGQMNQALSEVPHREVVFGFTELGRRGSRSMEEIEEATKRAEAAVERYVRELRDAFDVDMDLDRAQDGVKQGMFDLAEAVKENGRHWTDRTEAGRANRAELMNQVENLERVRLAEINAGRDVAATNLQFNAQLDALARWAAKAGATKDVLDDLVGDYKISITTTYREVGRPPRMIAGGDFQVFGGGRLLQFQGGGTTPALQPFKVHRDETLWADRQHYVATRAQTRALGGDGGTQRVEVVFRSDGTPIGDWLMEHTAGTVRNHGGRASLLGIKSLD